MTREFNADRVQLAWLCFGELDDSQFESKPFHYTWKHNPDDTEEKPGTFHNWYDGVPEWIEHDRGAQSQYDLAQFGNPDPVYFTAVRYNTFGQPSGTIVDSDGRTWELVTCFNVSPERECPCQDQEPRDDTWITEKHEGRCPYCEANIAASEEHGMVYVGEGMQECVYRRVPTDAEVCEGNDVEWYSETECEFTCPKCATVQRLTETEASYFTCQCGTDATPETVSKTGREPWWFVHREAGTRQSDATVSGPFDTEAECLREARTTV